MTQSIFQPGQIIPGLKINGIDAPYPVLNERAIRATAGIMFLTAIIGFSQAFYVQNYLPLKIIVLTFLLDFGIKIFINPKYAPYSIIGRFIVKKQKPEYVGAIQKRFAWSIGFIMALSMTFIFVIGNITGTIPILFCTICLTFMFMESAFGICVGCKIYWKFISWGLIKEPEVAPACPGGACPIPMKKNK